MIDTDLIFPLEPTWDDVTTREEVFRKRRFLDSVAGLVDYDLRSESPRMERIFRLIISREEAVIVREWIEENWFGQWKAFWMPTWIDDFPLAAPVGSGDTTFLCKGINRSDRWVGDARRRAIVAIAPGSPNPILYPAEINGITKAVDFGDETVTLVDAFGASLPRKRLVSWLMWGRLNSDSLRIQWVEPNTGFIELPFVELPWEAPAVG